MKFSKCIALNALIKSRRHSNRLNFDAISVDFNMYRVGAWAANIEFDEIVFNDEFDIIFTWVLANTKLHFMSANQNKITLYLQ